MTYAKHEGVKETFDFKGAIIIEINEITKRHKEDIGALFSRGLYVELILSFDEIKNIMYNICKSKENIELTKYLIKNANLIGNAFNLRTQERCFKLYEAAKRDNLDWKKEVDLFLKTEMTQIRKDLHRFTGFKPVKRIKFVRFLMGNYNFSYATSQRRISQAIYLGEIYDNELIKGGLVSMKPIKMINVKPKS